MPDGEESLKPPAVLTYAAPEPARSAFARTPTALIILVALLVPGLASWLLRGRRGFGWMLILCGTVVAAFLFFGPFWCEVLFRDSPLREDGLYPFIGVCVFVPLASVWLALRDRDAVMRRG